jgi:hypothetical protein
MAVGNFGLILAANQPVLGRIVAFAVLQFTKATRRGHQSRT